MTSLPRRFPVWSRYLLVPFAALCLQAQANVVVTGTRVVYKADEKEVTIRLNNEGGTPSLVQMWLDNGDPAATPDSAKVPFVMTPPLFRLDPGKAQAVRLTYTQEPLPSDRESIFWLNVLDIPPKPEKSAGDNNLQIALRSRLKVFFRPGGLPGNAAEAPRQLRWSLARTEAGAFVLKASNPTPYHVSFGRVSLVSGDKAVEQNASRPLMMVAPGDTISLDVNGLKQAPTAADHAEVHFTFIDDLGAITPETARLGN